MLFRSIGGIDDTPTRLRGETAFTTHAGTHDTSVWWHSSAARPACQRPDRPGLGQGQASMGRTGQPNRFARQPLRDNRMRQGACMIWTMLVVWYPAGFPQAGTL